MGNITRFLGGVFDKISQNFLVRLIINSNLCAGSILTPPFPPPPPFAFPLITHEQ